MQTQTQLSTFDKALLDFALACPVPTLDDVERWQAKYPEIADDILESAADTAQLLIRGAFDQPRASQPMSESTATTLVDLVMDTFRSAPSHDAQDQFVDRYVRRGR